MLLLATLIFGTGLPPMSVFSDANQACPGSGQGLRFTYRVDSGHCAPGGPCSTNSRAPNPQSTLVLRQQGCFWPEPVHFVRDGVCQGEPVWKAKGVVSRAPLRLEPWSGGQGMELQQGSQAPSRCPGPAKELQVIGPSPVPASSSYHSRGRADIHLEEQPDGQVVLHTPVGQHWEFEGDYRSEPMSREAALAAISEKAFMHHSLGTEMVAMQLELEGEQTLRPVPQMERPICVLTQDLELALVLGEDTVMRAAGTRNILADPARCGL